MRRILVLLNANVVFTKVSGLCNSIYTQWGITTFVWILNLLRLNISQVDEDSFNYDFLNPVKDIHIRNITFGEEILVETMNKQMMNVWVKVSSNLYSKFETHNLIFLLKLMKRHENLQVTFTLRHGRVYVNQVPIDPKVTINR